MVGIFYLGFFPDSWGKYFCCEIDQISTFLEEEFDRKEAKVDRIQASKV